MPHFIRAQLLIPSGASLSTTWQTFTGQTAGPASTGGVPMQGSFLVGISMPAAWDAAALTFQVGPNEAGMQNFYDRFGVEVTVQAAAARRIAIEPWIFPGISSLKVRSGTSGAAVNQTADRLIQLYFRQFE